MIGPYVLILFAAMLYAAGALVVKRATELGVGVWRLAFVANLTAAAMFQPLWLLGGELHAELWWQPVVVALCYVTGQALTFLSLERGDVSVATPVLGIKILLVAIIVTVWVGERLRWQLWLAAGLATVAIALLNRRSADGAYEHVGRTIVTASLAALSYTVLDVLLQQWAPAWGPGRFLPVLLIVTSVLSLAYIPRFRAPLRAIPPAARRWLAGGALLLGLQALMFVWTLAKWGHVAAINVVYSSRGLWSVVLVWLVGRWVRSRELDLAGGVLAWRLAGAVLMTLAIALVLW